MRLASIDIGTNTCNILIAVVLQGKNIKMLHREKMPIKLIDASYFNNTISNAAINRCINALLYYRDLIEEYNVDNSIAVTTSGVRSAVNGEQMLARFAKETGFDVKIIDGDEEAYLVYTGVKNAVKFDKNPTLIVDIGGGSVEFIICNDEELFWKKSYALGIARLLKKFNLEDPLSNKDILDLHTYFDLELQEVILKSKEYSAKKLVGSSGSFDTFKNLIICSFTGEIPDQHQPYYNIDFSSFDTIYNQLINLNIFERIRLKGMDPIRVEMMPAAAVMTKYLIDNVGVDIFLQSSYAIKEGLIFEYLNSVIK
jgi:exopolyphosphatase / guanosine-5'-triphosphate,3'-diphosphate pyrophosphatase